jgi:putative Mg2+ transporter-C (MgtC) family protein
VPIYDILIRTFLAVILGGLIGVERQSKHRPAGLRTHILVCLGSMSIMLTSQLLFIYYYTNYGIFIDPTRMSSQVVSGIGFLGAGTIIHSGGHVKGLTTAATLWVVGAIGLSIGAGFYTLSIIISITIFTVLITLNRFAEKMSNIGNVRDMVILLVNEPKVIGHLNLLLAKNEVSILDMTFLKESNALDTKTDKNLVSLKLVIRLNGDLKYEEFLLSILKLDGILEVDSLKDHI